MQSSSTPNDTHLPYSKWAQHRADNDLIYLAHPVTGEVKWLWSRHHDPKTEHDYLVNTVTGKREWVTKDNSHYCPVTKKTQPKSETSPQESTNTRSAARLALAQKPASSPTETSPSTVRKSPIDMPTIPEKIANTSRETSSNKLRPKYREIAAPKSLGLTNDEVLMIVPERGRRYIYNKKTKTSRWLPQSTSEESSSEMPSNIFGPPKPSVLPQSASNGNQQYRGYPEDRSQAANTIPNSGNGMLRNQNREGATNRQAETTGNVETELREQLQQLNTNGYTEQVQHLKQNDAGEGNEVFRRLHSLGAILDDVNKMTQSKKYNVAELRELSTGKSSNGEKQAASQRLLELEEYLTQQMLKVDGVESEGNPEIRAKRKETVKKILDLTDEIERMRTNLST